MSKSIWEIDFKEAVSRGMDSMQNKALSAFAKIEAMESKFEASMRRAGSVTASTANQSSISFGMLGAVLGGNLLTQVVNFGTQGVQSMLSIGANMELVHSGYETILKDSKLTEKTLADLKGFADWSPFNTQQVLQYGQDMLIAEVNANALIPTMSRLGDISGGNAEKMKGLAFVYNQTMIQGRARTQDLYQMMNAGMPIMRELQNITKLKGDALNAFIEDGGVTSKIVDQAINNMTNSGGMFFNSLQKGAATTTGKWNAFMSDIQNLAIKAFNDLKPYLNDLIDFGREILPVIGGGLKTIWNMAVGFGGWVKEHKGLLEALGIAVFGLASAYLAYRAEMMLYAGIQKGLLLFEQAHLFMLGMQEGLTIRATLAQMGLNTAFLLSPMGWVVGGIMAAVAALTYFWNTSRDFRKFIYELWGSVKEVFGNIGTIIWDALKGSAKLLLGIFEGNIELIKEGWADMSKGMETGMNSWEKGKHKGAQDFYGDEIKNKKVSSAAGYNAVAQLNNGQGGNADGAGGKGKGSSEGGSGGNSHRNVIVTINGGLIKELNLHATTVKEGLSNIREHVAEAIIGAVRDSELAIAQNGN